MRIPWKASFVLVALPVVVTACGGKIEPAGPSAGPPPWASDAQASTDAADVRADDAAPSGSGTRDASVDDANLDAGVAEPDADSSISCEAGAHNDNGGCIPDDPSNGLGSSAPCLLGGNVFHTNAEPDAYISSGVVDVPGQWAVSSQNYVEPNDVVLIEVLPRGTSAVMWSAVFMTEEFGASLETGKIYYPTESNYTTQRPPGTQALFHLQNDAYSCLDRSAAFIFDEFTPAGDGERLVSLTARFWVHCRGHAGVIRGCIHFHE
jgi:hypothetical protein